MFVWLSSRDLFIFSVSFFLFFPYFFYWSLLYKRESISIHLKVSTLEAYLLFTCGKILSAFIFSILISLLKLICKEKNSCLNQDVNPYFLPHMPMSVEGSTVTSAFYHASACSFPGGSYSKLSCGAILTVCSLKFIPFWLRKTSVNVEMYQLSFCVFICHSHSGISSFFW